MKKGKKKITEDGQKYINEYTREHYKGITIRFRNNDEEDNKIYNHLQEQENKTGYIKKLVKKDMK